MSLKVRDSLLYFVVCINITH